MTVAQNADLAALIRTIPDFPKPGILFRDITTLLLDGDGFRAASERLAALHPGPFDLVAGIEARGFIFGAAVARALGKGLVLIRKDGKLPGATIAVDYALEYGQDRSRSHRRPRWVPGRAGAADRRPHRHRGNGLRRDPAVAEGGRAVDAASFVIDLPDLGGADRIRAEGVAVGSLVTYPGH